MPARVYQLRNGMKPAADALQRALDDVSALERRPGPAPGPFRLRPRLDQTLRLLAGSARQKGIVLALDVAFEVPDALVGDARALRRTLAELVALGLRSLDRGEVVVHVRVASQTADEVMLRFAVHASDAVHGGTTFRFKTRYGLPRPNPHAVGAEAPTPSVPSDLEAASHDFGPGVVFLTMA